MLNVSKAMVAAAVQKYFEQGDYYFEGYNPPGLWGGELAKQLGLEGEIEKIHFDRMADGLDPFTGQQLTARLNKTRRSANDITISAPKELSLLHVRTGDERILDIFTESCDWIMGVMEKDAATRVRIGGADEDRITGNWAYAGFVHLETRTDKDSQLPDPQLHRHHVCFNLTNDPVEKRIKALQIGFIKENADLYMPMFHNELARRVRELGYGIERPTGKVGFGITGVPRELVEKFSRRRLTILRAKKEIAEAQGITDPERLRRLQAELAVLTRKYKKKDLTIEELWKSWNDRMTGADRAVLDRCKTLAGKGWKTTNAQALAFATEHVFERSSVVPEKELLAEALRYGVGSVTLEGLKAEYERFGVRVKDGEATTKAVHAQEGRIIDFAEAGRGTCRPLAKAALAEEKKLAALSAEQRMVCKHIWGSTDRFGLIRGSPGVGKTFLQQTAFGAIDRPKAFLAPNVEGGRGVLRKTFKDANTVAAFLRDKEWQKRMRGGIVVIDEFGLLPIKDLDALCQVAKEHDLRLWGFGDPDQHKSVARHGNMFHVLPKYAGIVVPHMKDIRRQKGRYLEVTKALVDKKPEEALQIMEELGFIQYVKTEEVCHAVVQEWTEDRQKG